MFIIFFLISSLTFSALGNISLNEKCQEITRQYCEKHHKLKIWGVPKNTIFYDNDICVISYESEPFDFDCAKGTDAFEINLKKEEVISHQHYDDDCDWPY